MQAITLEPLTLLRPVDPADTTLAEQVCQVANDADQHGKLKGQATDRGRRGPQRSRRHLATRSLSPPGFEPVRRR